jgi:hypothetical protein
LASLFSCGWGLLEFFFLDGLNHFRDDIVEVADDFIMGDVEYGGLRVVIDARFWLWFIPA